MAGALFYKFSNIFSLFIAAYFIAYIFEPAVNFFVKKNVKRWLAVTLVWFFVLNFFILFIFPVAFSFLKEISQIQIKFGHYNENITKSMVYVKKLEKKYQILSYVNKLGLSEKDFVDYFVTTSKKFLKITGNFVKANVMKIISSVMWLFMLPVITFYIMLDFEELNSYMKKIEFKGKKSLKSLFLQIEKEMSAFFRGQLLVCFFIGVLMGLGFYFIGIDFPLFLGMLAGFSNLVPYLGVFISTMAAIILAILKFGFSKALISAIVKILLLVVAVQTMDGMLISPKILSNSIDISPVIVMLFLFLGGAFGGVLGMLLAVPSLIVIKVLVKNVRIRFK
jgi:predicted PurR-regulated permease PerM